VHEYARVGGWVALPGCVSVGVGGGVCAVEGVRACVRRCRPQVPVRGVWCVDCGTWHGGLALLGRGSLLWWRWLGALCEKLKTGGPTIANLSCLEFL
jgi:hypothetical protein